MSDSLKNVAKTLQSGGKDAEYALKRYAPKRPRVERVLDTFDSIRLFSFTFEVKENEEQIRLDLQFKPPPPNSCCSGNICGACESFTAGNETLIMSRAYIPHSVSVTINGRSRSEFTETDPAQRIVTINLNISPGTTVRVCYTYSIQTLFPGDTVNTIGGGSSGGSGNPVSGGGTVVLPAGSPATPTNLQANLSGQTATISWS